MTTKLSDDLRQAIEEHSGAPVYVADAITGAGYVLMRKSGVRRKSGVSLNAAARDPRG